ncbi:hypothetical protein J4232_03065 [Candidatus Woesearchaeota archaeon]|nr:hypothetical protein [Candidatus Woesearchaeota archaeon]
MENKRTLFIFILLLMTISFSSFVLAEQTAAGDITEIDDDIQFAGFELEELLNLGAGLLALALFVITVVAYNRTENKRLVYVSIAFLLFSVKGFLTSHELFFNELQLIDPLASALNFAIILCFFLGVVKN